MQFLILLTSFEGSGFSRGYDRSCFSLTGDKDTDSEREILQYSIVDDERASTRGRRSSRIDVPLTPPLSCIRFNIA